MAHTHTGRQEQQELQDAAAPGEAL